MLLEFTSTLINKIAQLVSLPLSSTESEDFADMFNSTLTYIEVLNELDTASVSETYQVNGQKNVFQPELEESNTLSTSAALSNAFSTKKNLFATKGVFDQSTS